MTDESKSSIWPLVLMMIAAVGIYLYYSIEITPPAIGGRERGGVDAVEALAERDPVSYTHLTLPTICSV